MGRTKKNRPAHTRAKAAGEQAMQVMDEYRKEAVLHGKSDESIFVLDNQGSTRKRRKIEKQAKTEKFLSKNEKQIIVHKYLGKAMAGSTRKPKRALIVDPWADEDGLTQGSESVSGSEPARDVQAKAATASIVKREDGFVQMPRKPGQGVKRPKPTARESAKLGVCHPGQSYNPTQDDHEDVLASAVAVELRRAEAEAEQQKPLSAGMSAETKAILLGDEDDGSSDEEDEAQSEGATLADTNKHSTSATGKLTRAQRNKQARVKQMSMALAERKRKKDLLKSIDSLAAIQGELAEEEEKRAESRRLKLVYKAQRKNNSASSGSLFGPQTGVSGIGPGKHGIQEIIFGRSVPVNLSQDLHGSLRQLRTQGSIFMDKVELLKRSKAHPVKRIRKERAKKAPKGIHKKYKIQDRSKVD